MTNFKLIFNGIRELYETLFIEKNMQSREQTLKGMLENKNNNIGRRKLNIKQVEKLIEENILNERQNDSSSNFDISTKIRLLEYYIDIIDKTKKEPNIDLLLSLLEEALIRNQLEEVRGIDNNKTITSLELLKVINDIFMKGPTVTKYLLLKGVKELLVECSICYIYFHDIRGETIKYKKIKYENRASFYNFLSNYMCEVVGATFIGVIDVQEISQNIIDKADKINQKSSGSSMWAIDHIFTNNEIRQEKIKDIFEQLDKLKDINKMVSFENKIIEQNNLEQKKKVVKKL